MILFVLGMEKCQPGAIEHIHAIYAAYAAYAAYCKSGWTYSASQSTFFLYLHPSGISVSQLSLRHLTESRLL